MCTAKRGGGLAGEAAGHMGWGGQEGSESSSRARELLPHFQQRTGMIDRRKENIKEIDHQLVMI